MKSAGQRKTVRRSTKPDSLAKPDSVIPAHKPAPVKRTNANMATATRLTLLFCVTFVLISLIISEDGSLVLASGKKKFLKGFILGALLSKSHYPVVYSMPSHGHGGHGGGGYGW